MEVQRNIREDIRGCKAEMRLGAEDELASNGLDVVLVRGSRGLALKGSSLEASDGLAVVGLSVGTSDGLVDGRDAVLLS